MPPSSEVETPAENCNSGDLGTFDGSYSYLPPLPNALDSNYYFYVDGPGEAYYFVDTPDVIYQYYFVANNKCCGQCGKCGVEVETEEHKCKVPIFENKTCEFTVEEESEYTPPKCLGPNCERQVKCVGDNCPKPVNVYERHGCEYYGNCSRTFETTYEETFSETFSEHFSEHFEHEEHSEHEYEYTTSEHSEHSEHSDHSEHSEHSEHSDHSEHSEHSEHFEETFTEKVGCEALGICSCDHWNNCTVGEPRGCEFYGNCSCEYLGTCKRSQTS